MINEDRKHMKIRSGMTLETDELIEALTQEEAEQLIKDIDLAMADYDFTERIAKHLIQALADECKAGCEEFDFSALSPNGEVRGASRPAGEASSAEGATSTVVLERKEMTR